MEGIRPLREKPKYDIGLSTGEYLILRTNGEHKTSGGEDYKGQYIITIDAFGKPKVDKELRVYG